MWDLYRGRLGIIINKACSFCGGPSTGNHMIRCEWINQGLKRFVKIYDKKNKKNNWNKTMNPLNLPYDTILNSELVKFMWAIWKTYCKNNMLNEADNWKELWTQHRREIYNYKQQSRPKMKIPTAYEVEQKWKEPQRWNCRRQL